MLWQDDGSRSMVVSYWDILYANTDHKMTCIKSIRFEKRENKAAHHITDATRKQERVRTWFCFRECLLFNTMYERRRVIAVEIFTNGLRSSYQVMSLLKGNWLLKGFSMTIWSQETISFANITCHKSAVHLTVWTYSSEIRYRRTKSKGKCV